MSTFLACNDVIAERIASSADVERTCVEWIDGTDRQFGPSCFRGSDKHRWEAFLVAIENHGGWSNINDEQVKIDAVAAGELAKKHRRDSAKRRRGLEKQRRQGAVRSLTPELLAAVKEEGDSRANHLKTLKVVRGAKPQDTLWITSLPDSTCERIADVWRIRETLRYYKENCTGKEIAERLLDENPSSSLSLGSLQARVSQDLKRIKKLENDDRGEPIWAKWTFPA